MFVWMYSLATCDTGDRSVSCAFCSSGCYTALARSSETERIKRFLSKDAEKERDDQRLTGGSEKSREKNEGANERHRWTNEQQNKRKEEIER